MTLILSAEEVNECFEGFGSLQGVHYNEDTLYYEDYHVYVYDYILTLNHAHLCTVLCENTPLQFIAFTGFLLENTSVNVTTMWTYPKQWILWIPFDYILVLDIIKSMSCEMCKKYHCVCVHRQKRTCF